MAPKRETALELWGKEFACAREEAGLSQASLAKDAYLSPSLIGMWETGKRTPKPQDLARCEERLGTKGRLAWSLRNWVPREVAHEWVDDWISIEEQARSLLWFETMVIPGLLQTEEYARAVLTTGEQPPTNIEEKVAIRLERQRILEDNPPTLIAIMDESVVRRPVGGNKVMYEQLVHLVRMAQRNEVIIQIVPMSVGAYGGLNGPIVIASLDSRDVAYLDNAISGEVVENSEDVAAARRLLEAFRAKALDEAASIRLIMEVAKAYEVA